MGAIRKLVKFDCLALYSSQCLVMAYVIDTPSRCLDSYIILTPADVGRHLDSYIIHTSADRVAALLTSSA